MLRCRSYMPCCVYSEKAWEKFSKRFTMPPNTFTIDLNNNKRWDNLVKSSGNCKGFNFELWLSAQNLFNHRNNKSCLQCSFTIRQCCVFNTGLLDPGRAALTCKCHVFHSQLWVPLLYVDLCHPKFIYGLVLQNVNLFGNRFFTETIKVKWGHCSKL